MNEVLKDDAQGVRQKREGGGLGLERPTIWEMARKKMEQDKFTVNSNVVPPASQQRIGKLSLLDPDDERYK